MKTVPQLLKLEDAKGYAKHTESKAVLNIDNTGLEAYKMRRRECEELKAAITDINTVKSELQEVKGLLLQFLKETKNA